jgi:hypothetical protein
LFERPDHDTWGEVVKDVIAGQFGLDPELFVVRVRSGIVAAARPVQRGADALSLVGTIRYLEGVVGIRDRLSYSSQS